MKRIGKTPPPKRLVGCELIALAARDPAAFVETCEQRYHDRLDAVAQKALEAGVQIIMLTGPSAAGKTTTAHKLADRIAAAGVRSAVMSLDDFFVGEGRYPKQPDGSDDYECVEALDLPVLRGCLRSLAETGVCDAPVFSFLQQRPTGETHRIDARGGIAIVEGLHAFNPALAVDELPDGTALHLYAEPGKQKVTLTLPSGPPLTMDDEGKKIALQDKGGENALTMDLQGGNVELKAKTKLTLSAGTGASLVLEASGNVTEKANVKVAVQAATIEEKASAQMTIQGGMVSIN